jgi:ATP-binding cassette, subfamily B, bacterial PglK
MAHSRSSSARPEWRCYLWRRKYMSTAKKIHQLLTREQRRAAVLVFVVMLIGMALETFGIGLVIPVLGLLSSQDLAASYPVLEPVLEVLGNPTHKQLITGGMLVLAGIYAIKALFLAFLAWNQSRFIYDVQAGLSHRLFTGYLRQPWAFHLQRNSAQLIRNTTGEINQFTGNALIPGMLLLTELLVAIGIGTLLLAVEPVGALLVVATLGLAAWGFQRLTRGHILRWGQARQYHEGLRIQHLQQGLGGAKDVKLLGREVEFFDQYNRHNLGSARAARRQNTIKQLPRLWLELLAVTGLSVLVLVMIGQGKPLTALLPTLGLFAAAAFRLLPSVNRILSAVQSLRYGLPVIETLHREIRLLEGAALPARKGLLPFSATLALEDVCFQYANARGFALNHVTLNIRRGDSVGFIGGSGAGKSTLVDVILGLLVPASGRVLVDGVDIQSNLRGWQDQIGYVPQSIFLTDDSLRRNVAFGLADAQIDDEAVRRAIRAAQVEEFIDGLPNGLNTMVGEQGVRLSGGQRQRIGIARALYHDPPVLVLDEATSSLDTETERGVMDAVNALQGGKTILIVAHRLSTVANCDHLYRLTEGRLADQGSFDDVASTPMAKTK